MAGFGRWIGRTQHLILRWQTGYYLFTLSCCVHLRLCSKFGGMFVDLNKGQLLAMTICIFKRVWKNNVGGMKIDKGAVIRCGERWEWLLRTDWFGDPKRLIPHVTLEEPLTQHFPTRVCDGTKNKNPLLFFLSSLVVSSGWFWLQTEMSTTAGQPRRQTTGRPTVISSVVSLHCSSDEVAGWVAFLSMVPAPTECSHVFSSYPEREVSWNRKKNTKNHCYIYSSVVVSSSILWPDSSRVFLILSLWVPCPQYTIFNWPMSPLQYTALCYWHGNQS